MSAASQTNQAGQPLLALNGVSKQFSGIHALQDVSLALWRGEVHALAGENGAGKSTLIKILGGVLAADQGQLMIDGEKITLHSAEAARRLGISVIYQDFDLVPALSVADNILLGQHPTHRLGLIHQRKSREQAQRAMSRVGLKLDHRTPVARLTTAQRQLLAIARAVCRQCRVLIMDEPTSALSEEDIAHLLELVRSLRQSGMAILFISHKLDEVFALADRITVLKDGRLVACRKAADTSPGELINLMVGRTLDELFTREPHPAGDVLLEARSLGRKTRFADISFSLRRNEIVGLYGLKGAGRSDLADALFGLIKTDCGELFLRGEPVQIKTPQDAIRHGIGRLPEDRKALGVFANLDLKSNMSLSALAAMSRFGLIRRQFERDAVSAYIQKLNIRTTGPDQMMTRLSGGNQQKVLLARWLLGEPELLILDEPTAGIDIGAKAEIYRFIDRLAAGGMTILLITSELPELLGLSDRILVMHEGRITAHLTRAQASESSVMKAIHTA